MTNKIVKRNKRVLQASDVQAKMVHIAQKVGGTRVNGGPAAKLCPGPSLHPNQSMVVLKTHTHKFKIKEQHHLFHKRCKTIFK